MTLLIDTPAVFTRRAGFVRLTGPDRLSYLHSLLSQAVEDARPGEAADFLYLDAKGNPLAAGRLLARSDDVLLVVPPAVTEPFAAALDRFRFLMQVEAEVLSGWALASVRGPEPETTIAGLDAPDEALRFAERDGGLVLRDRSGGLDLVGPRAWVEEYVAASGLPRAGEPDWQAWRIAVGEPAWDSELAAGRRAQELGLLPTHVHLRKGCYPGQESIAKTYNLGRPRRALAVLGSDHRIEPGTEVSTGGRPGIVTSAAEHDDAWLALALVPLGRDGILPEKVEIAGVGARVLRRVGEGLDQPGE